VSPACFSNNLVSGAFLADPRFFCFRAWAFLESLGTATFEMFVLFFLSEVLGIPVFWHFFFLNGWIYPPEFTFFFVFMNLSFAGSPLVFLLGVE